MPDHRPGLLRKLLLAFGLFIALAAPSCAPADEGGFPDILGLRGKGAPAQSPAEFTAALVPDGQAGVVTLRLSAKLPPEHYIYSTTPGQGPETKITINEPQGLDAIDRAFEADHPPEAVEDPDLERTVEKYYKKVTWSRRFRLQSGVAPQRVSVSGLVKYTVCHPGDCRFGKYEFDVKLADAGVAQPAPSTVPVADAATRFEHLVGSRNSQRLGSAWTVALQPRQARPGDEVVLSVEVHLEPGWHVYAIDQGQLPNGDGPFPTVMGLTEAGGLVPVDLTFQGPKPIEKPSEGWPGLVERYHEGPVKWTRRFRVPEAAAAGNISLAGKVAWQMCNSGGCQPPTGFAFRGELMIGSERSSESVLCSITERLRGGAAAAAIDELRLGSKNLVPKGVDELPSPERGPAVVRSPRDQLADSRPADEGARPAAARGGARTEGAIDKSQGLPFFLAAAVLAGFAALLTPCVFPMIPITVSFFQKQSEKEHHRPITMATVYCLGIIGTFTGLGMLMSIAISATAIQQLASNWVVNLFIAGVLVFFAFNLLGMFEIQMPSWLLTYTAGQEGRGGFLGVLFMALTFTLTSFTCTFAFAGGLLAAAAQGDRLWPTLGLLAFSAAFSLPFFFLALFPSLLQKLPRSGGWMNVVKVVMGLIELGAAFKFFGNVDTTWNGQPAIFDFHLMISAWAVISIAAAMYLLGVFRLPHDMPTDHIGVVRFIFAMSFLGFASYLGVGLFATDKPHGVVWRYVEAFANPNFEGGSDPSGPWLKHGGLRYALDFEKAFETAIAADKPLFLDFTGVTCTNCRYMEKGPMSQPDIEQRLRNFVRVQLFTDSVPIADKKEAARLLDLNVRLQEDWYGDVTLPSYVVIPPDRSVLKDPSKIIWDLKGKKDEADFAQFLDKGWEGWNRLQASRGAKVVGQR
ncbi:MAG: cytochrome c biogenesis protein CcdA [Deltaproteobacteria bacterium]